MNFKQIRGSMTERVKSWADKTSVQLIAVIISGAFATGGVYGVLSYKVDASDLRSASTVEQLQDTNDKLVLMATDVAVIRTEQKNSVKKLDRVEEKLDALILQKPVR